MTDEFFFANKNVRIDTSPPIPFRVVCGDGEGHFAVSRSHMDQLDGRDLLQLCVQSVSAKSTVSHSPEVRSTDYLQMYLLLSRTLAQSMGLAKGDGQIHLVPFDTWEYTKVPSLQHLLVRRLLLSIASVDRVVRLFCAEKDRPAPFLIDASLKYWRGWSDIHIDWQAPPRQDTCRRLSSGNEGNSDVAIESSSPRWDRGRFQSLFARTSQIASEDHARVTQDSQNNGVTSSDTELAPAILAIRGLHTIAFDASTLRSATSSAEAGSDQEKDKTLLTDQATHEFPSSKDVAHESNQCYERPPSRFSDESVLARNVYKNKSWHKLATVSQRKLASLSRIPTGINIGSSELESESKKHSSQQKSMHCSPDMYSSEQTNAKSTGANCEDKGDRQHQKYQRSEKPTCKMQQHYRTSMATRSNNRNIAAEGCGSSTRSHQAHNRNGGSSFQERVQRILINSDLNSVPDANNNALEPLTGGYNSNSSVRCTCVHPPTNNVMHSAAIEELVEAEESTSDKRWTSRSFTNLSAERTANLSCDSPTNVDCKIIDHNRLHDQQKDKYRNHFASSSSSSVDSLVRQKRRSILERLRLLVAPFTYSKSEVTSVSFWRSTEPCVQLSNFFISPCLCGAAE